MWPCLAFYPENSLTTVVSLDPQAHLLNPGSPLATSQVSLFVPKSENSPKAGRWDNRTVPSFISQLSWITVHFLIANVSQIVSYILSGFVFFSVLRLNLVPVILSLLETNVYLRFWKIFAGNRIVGWWRFFLFFFWDLRKRHSIFFLTCRMSSFSA